MGAANVGPEFTEREYEGLMELCELEQELYAENKIARLSELKAYLWDAVISSQRWKKWLHEGEPTFDFYDNTLERQTWLIKTGCRYIWENPSVVASRNRLYKNLQFNHVDAEGIVLSHIEQAMDKYFHKFNLVDLNELIEAEELSVA
jgi:tagatose-1,6-bisphosphate aldolase non-catalytic subunit AgaZ/GatZ